MFSVFSESAPRDIKSTYAFRIYGEVCVRACVRVCGRCACGGYGCRRVSSANRRPGTSIQCMPSGSTVKCACVRGCVGRCACVLVCVQGVEMCDHVLKSLVRCVRFSVCECADACV